MNTALRNRIAGILSARGFLTAAVLSFAGFCIVHALGLRHCTGVLCGTLTEDPLLSLFYAGCGLLYVAAYLAAVVGGPVLLIAAALIAWAGDSGE
jgi:hypothetical protein